MVMAAPVLVLSLLAVSAYVYFRDDIVGSLIARQNEMQFAYEDKLAAMRVQMDRVTSRQLLDQNTIEGRVHELLSRQAMLENRTSLIKTLADQAGLKPDGVTTAPQTIRADARGNPLLADPASYRQPAALPPEASAFAPLPSPAPLREPAPSATPRSKPRPEGLELRGNLEASEHPLLAEAENPDIPVPARLGALSSGLERMERSRIRALAKIGDAARQRTDRIRTVVQAAGLSLDRLQTSTISAAANVGGPFVPPKLSGEGSAFEQELNRAQRDFSDAARFNQQLAYLPLRRPLSGQPDVTSPFGNRIDPFFGRLALHSGVDLRDEYGAPVRATAAGKVVTAGWSGGYGNLVEIDHGNGLSTRYGHLASISVSEGQSVDAGAVVGKLGSTGRSTGPHLHYEVRIDGEPVDPMRFVRASYKAEALN
jgi:murein DD-endopeptidase MepM/ murein hydrolase activator NlpD